MPSMKVVAEPGGEARVRVDDRLREVPDRVEGRRGDAAVPAAAAAAARGGAGGGGRRGGRGGARGGAAAAAALRRRPRPSRRAARGGAGRVGGGLHAGLDDAGGEHPAGLGAGGEGEPALADLVDALEEPHEAEPHAEEEGPVAADLVGEEAADDGAAAP